MKKQQFEMYKELLNNGVNSYTLISTIKNKEDFLSIYSYFPLNIKFKIIDGTKKMLYNSYKSKYSFEPSDYDKMVQIISDDLDVFTWSFIRLLYNNRYLTEDYFLNYYHKFPVWAIQKLNMETKIFNNCSDSVKLILSVLNADTADTQYYLETLKSANKINVLNTLNKYSENLIYNYNYLFNIPTIKQKYISHIIDEHVSHMFNSLSAHHIYFNPSNDKRVLAYSINIGDTSNGIIRLFNFNRIVKFINLFIPFTESTQTNELLQSINKFIINNDRNSLYELFLHLHDSLPKSDDGKNSQQDYFYREKLNLLIDVLETFYLKLKEYDFDHIENIKTSDLYRDIAYILTYAYYIYNSHNRSIVEYIPLGLNKYQYTLLCRIYKDANLPVKFVNIGRFQSYGIFRISIRSIVSDIIKNKDILYDYYTTSGQIRSLFYVIPNIDFCEEFYNYMKYYNYNIDDIVKNLIVVEKQQCTFHEAPFKSIFIYNNDQKNNKEYSIIQNNSYDLLYCIWHLLISKIDKPNIHISEQLSYDKLSDIKAEKSDTDYCLYTTKIYTKTTSFIDLPYNDIENKDIKNINSFDDIELEDFKYNALLTYRITSSIDMVEIRYINN